MTDTEHQRHARDVIAQARDEYERRRDSITLVAVAVLIGALLVIGAALAGGQ
jgi:hypothetical protein